jgi:hypothetical protein
MELIARITRPPVQRGQALVQVLEGSFPGKALPVPGRRTQYGDSGRGEVVACAEHGVAGPLGERVREAVAEVECGRMASLAVPAPPADRAGRADFPSSLVIATVILSVVLPRCRRAVIATLCALYGLVFFASRPWPRLI